MDLEGILETLADLINLATPIVVALALLYFFWGLANYILAAEKDDDRKKARSIMVYGLLALFIMVSVWGIINVVRDTFDLDDTNIDVPGININGNQTQ